MKPQVKLSSTVSPVSLVLMLASLFFFSMLAVKPSFLQLCGLSVSPNCKHNEPASISYRPPKVLSIFFFWVGILQCALRST